MEVSPAEVVVVQQAAIVDHVCVVEERMLPALLGGGEETGGSRRVAPDELSALLERVGQFSSRAGGSATNVARGLAGFGVCAALVGARGDDAWGAELDASLARAGVDASRMRVLAGRPTGRCCVLASGAQRTMRTCLKGAAALAADDLAPADVAGATWAFLSSYSLYAPGLLQRAAEVAAAAGANVALDLASFEIVRAHLPVLRALLEAGRVALCFANEDEAREILGGSSGGGSGAAAGGAGTPEQGLAYLARHCTRAAVVTLAERGCLVQAYGSEEVIRQPACSGVQAVDSTGAGDLFAAGFVYSLLQGAPLARCAELGCIAGGAVVQAVGAELTPEAWRWLRARECGQQAAAGGGLLVQA